MSKYYLLVALLIGLFPDSGAWAAGRAQLLAEAESSTATVFDVFVPPERDPALDALLAAQVTPGSSEYHRFLSPAEYRARFGTSLSRMAEVAAALRAAGFTVEEGRAHVLRVQGTVATVEHAFATRLSDAVFPSGLHGLVAGPRLKLPAALARAGAIIPAFADTIRMHRHSRVSGEILPDNRMGAHGPYWVTDLKQAYDLPDERLLNGRGVTVGILMEGNYNKSDMTMYFHHEKLAVPAITVEDILGGTPYSADNSVETHLDLQQAGGMAPKAAFKLYNLPSLTDDAVLGGVVDIDEENAVDIVSMSFGGPEIAYTAAYNNGQDETGILRALDTLFKQGNAQGITFVASSGDAGALGAPPLACFAPSAQWDCGFYGLSVEHPASSPYVTAVGGSNLATSTDPSHPGDLGSAYLSENAYYDRLAYDPYYNTPAQGVIWGSGGGVSFFEPKPVWQKLAPTGSGSLRTVPDVAGHMGGCIDAAIQPCEPGRSADVVTIGGILYAVTGTSASAPGFAGILALKAQHLQSRLGNMNPEIYALGHAQRAHVGPRVFHDHLPGDNGYYASSPGYNLVLGNGTVIVRPFLGVSNLPAAGVPQSASNP